MRQGELKKKVVMLISVIVSLGGLAVMCGWIFDLGFLKSISPSWVTMKFNTALSFFLSGISLYFAHEAANGDSGWSHPALAATSLLIFLIIGTSLISGVVGVATGIESMFFGEKPGATDTIVPGRPAFPTMFNFMLVACIGILAILRPGRLKRAAVIIGLITVLSGTITVLGYIANTPALYFYFPETSTAMACNTAALFILLGVGLLCL